MNYPFKPAEKWDVHTHTTTSPDTFKALEKYANKYEQFIRVSAHPQLSCCAQMVNARGEVSRVIEADAFDGRIRVDDCDLVGVTRQVLSPTPMMIPDYVDDARDASEICQILNDENARIVDQFPERFLALGALPMNFPELAIEELHRIKSMGFRGVEINSNINGKDLDDPRFFPIFKAIDELNFCVFIHPWGGLMAPEGGSLKERMSAKRNWRPWLIGMGSETAMAFDAMRSGGVHERLPSLRVMYAHGGGTFPWLLGRLEHGAYCRPDIFASASQMDPYETVRSCGVYTDTLTHNPWALKQLIDCLGTKRVAMGSDYPYPLGEIEPFDVSSLLDPKGNQCPYHKVKRIYPGHMIEHLPELSTSMEQAWDYFNWLPRHNADGARDLPILSVEQKQQLLSETAKAWLFGENRVN